MFVSRTARSSCSSLMKLISMAVLHSAEVHALVQQHHSRRYGVCPLHLFRPFLHGVCQRLAKVSFFAAPGGSRQPAEFSLHLGVDVEGKRLCGHTMYLEPVAFKSYMM